MERMTGGGGREAAYMKGLVYCSVPFRRLVVFCACTSKPYLKVPLGRSTGGGMGGEGEHTYTHAHAAHTHSKDRYVPGTRKHEHKHDGAGGTPAGIARATQYLY
jgi:hypothetical protein